MVQFDANGMTSRLRRDVRAVYDQTGAALACGDQPLVTVRVVGRVVGVFNQFYSLCSYCGCLCTVGQNNRYGSEICCLRCDFNMLYRDRQAPEVVSEPSLLVKCRYCGREDRKKPNDKCFKIVKAPLDAVGYNKDLPRPLRWVAFCKAHCKPWIHTALNVMKMSEVFSHILSKCRPIFAAAGGQKAIEYSGDPAAGESNVGRPKKRKRSVTSVMRKGGAVARVQGGGATLVSEAVACGKRPKITAAAAP